MYDGASRHNRHVESGSHFTSCPVFNSYLSRTSLPVACHLFWIKRSARVSFISLLEFGVFLRGVVGDCLCFRFPICTLGSMRMNPLLHIAELTVYCIQYSQEEVQKQS